MMYQVENRQSVEVARLEDYLNAFRQRWLLVLSCVLLGLLLALLYARTANNSYTATAQVRLAPTPVGSVNNNLRSPNLEEERVVVFSDDVGAAVAQSFPNVDRDAIDVRFTPNSDILLISYTAPDPTQAANIAQAFASVYAEGRTERARNYYQRGIDEQEALIAGFDADLEVRRNLLAELRQQSANLGSGANAAVEADILLVSREIDALLRQKSTAQNAAVTAGNGLLSVEAEPPGDVLVEARVPTSPDGIPRALLLLLGLALGLAFGLIAAFLLERLDTTARDENDVALALNTSVIGGIPTLGIGSRRGVNAMIMLSSGGSARVEAAREAFRRLRNSLVFLNTSTGACSVIVTSSSPSEGKSFTAANLSIAMAQNGSRVVLVSADLRRPSLERMFGMEAQRPGLAEYLSQTAELNAEKVSGLENLWLIRSGVPPANPSELLNSDRFEQLIKELEREDVDYIIVDTPPVLSTSDAMSAARYVDGVIIVVDAEQTSTPDLLQSRADLERTGTKLLGAVLNRRKFDGGGLFRRNNKHAYYQAEAGRVRGG